MVAVWLLDAANSLMPGFLAPRIASALIVSALFVSALTASRQLPSFLTATGLAALTRILHLISRYWVFEDLDHWR